MMRDDCPTIEAKRTTRDQRPTTVAVCFPPIVLKKAGIAAFPPFRSIVVMNNASTVRGVFVLIPHLLRD